MTIDEIVAGLRRVLAMYGPDGGMGSDAFSCEHYDVVEGATGALERCASMLSHLEFSVPSFAETGNDTRACPECGAHAIVGLEHRAHHAPDCALAALLATDISDDR